ncbi:hypothetical protein V8G54_028421 [Vigna mungo]|uniref:Uncharacterized protein n=1 Tax=Vigna mungo TaxID=3915 RepID=A0AAQ3MSM6_VIGMU
MRSVVRLQQRRVVSTHLFHTETKLITDIFSFFLSFWFFDSILPLELNDLRDVDWITINAIRPRPINRCFDVSVALPHGTVAFKPTPERYLPHPISSLHPSL